MPPKSRCSEAGDIDASATIEVIEDDADGFDDEDDMLTVRGSQLDGRDNYHARREEHTVSQMTDGDLSATQENIPELNIEQS